MHYYIDGYNLLFRQRHTSASFQDQRLAIIREINEKASVVNIDVSIVFDATYQPGDGSRSHFAHVEILFSSYGQTADACILEALRYCHNPAQETVVTSDKELARLSRHYSASAITIEHFLMWLNRTYEKRANKKPKLQKSLQITAPIQVEKKQEPTVLAETIPKKDLSVTGCLNYYADIFEKKWQKHLEEEKQIEIQKIQIEEQTRKFIKRRPKIKKDPFASEETDAVKASNEIDRWLILFEQRLTDEL